MKLATVKNGHPDGRLVIVSRDLQHAVQAPVTTMQAAMETWDNVLPELQAWYENLNAGRLNAAFAFDVQAAAAPLPRAYQWCDGSAFLNHGHLMERAFNTEPIPDFETVPVMYQGSGDDFLGPHEVVPLPSVNHGIDFEGEFGVITGPVPLGTSPEQAAWHVRLLVQINDWSLRSFGPREMKTGFGFLQAKPSTAFAPVAVTPDELGDAWHEGRVELDLHIHWNGEWFGHPNGREMNFDFRQLIAHAAATRRLGAGTVIGSGTVSNKSREVGSACISERRVIEMIDQGQARTAYMQFGDRVRMEARDAFGQAPFGVIDQEVVQSPTP
ncbi:fumarylacetoacetate hydrolase family protein [Variovorax sp. HJSM1_2]|uniref:fumarylacetoacetate hydrolase family protein n=1 Tax=Variovorax sp. HJSM1_2 TaxID=3366263 RepID=UPI003BD384CE